jgi:hypothetical protein
MRSDPDSIANELYNNACTRTGLSKLGWFNTRVSIAHIGSDQCEIFLDVNIPHGSCTVYESFCFNDIPGAVKCYEILRNKIVINSMITISPFLVVLGAIFLCSKIFG